MYFIRNHQNININLFFVNGIHLGDTDSVWYWHRGSKLYINTKLISFYWYSIMIHPFIASVWGNKNKSKYFRFLFALYKSYIHCIIFVYCIYAMTLSSLIAPLGDVNEKGNKHLILCIILIKFPSMNIYVWIESNNVLRMRTDVYSTNS